MISVLLTQYDGKIIGPVAKLLGYLMNGIFVLLDKIGIPNIGLAIIIFTIVIYLVLTPLTIKQQKFSKLSAKMNPEIQAIQAKYKGKRDQDSMTKMNEETKAVYAKYGVSPSGSCVQLLIQMPILFALYRVIYAMPAYVTKVGDTFRVLADKIIASDGANFIKSSELSSIASAVKMYSANIEGNLSNGIIDVLNKITTSDMKVIAEHYNLSDLLFNGQPILSNGSVRGLIDTYNNFLGINIGNSPSYMCQQAFSSKQFGLLIVGILIPFLAAATQWINTKLMPQAENANNGQDTVAASMKTMNVMMPIMSAVFCFTLPAGMGLYWIAGAVIRSVQQVVINKKIDQIDFDAMIEKNMEKQAKKIEKSGVAKSTLKNSASISTKAYVNNSSKSQAEKDEAVKKATEYYNKGAKPGSLAAKANMVKAYNEKNNQ